MRIILVLCLSLCITAQAADWQPITLSGNEGTYMLDQWTHDWPGCQWADGIKAGRVSVTKDHALRVTYAAGKIGPDDGGCGWRWPYTKAYNPSAEVRYTVVFEEGFEFVKGGKLPGLCGGPKNISGGKAVTGRDGWSARLMWRKDGRGQAYVYHVNQPDQYGDQFYFPEDFRFPIGQPVGVRMRVSMNTVGRRDGAAQVWITLPGKAEQLLVDHHDLEWRTVAGIGVDSVMFETFHGGGDNSWAPAKACSARFSDVAWRAGSE